MGKYSQNKPPRGRERAAGNVRAPGAPKPVEEDFTPMEGLVTEDGHVNSDMALQLLIAQNRKMERHVDSLVAAKVSEEAKAEASQRQEVNVYESGIGWWQKFGVWLWRGVTLLGATFAVGVSYAVWMGENATDSEVEKAIESTVEEKILPAHAEATIFHEKIDVRVKKIEVDMTSLDMTQRILDKRSEYQFELGRWQAQVLEAERKRKKPPKKPPRIDQLERELMGFGKQP